MIRSDKLENEALTNIWESQDSILIKKSYNNIILNKFYGKRDKGKYILRWNGLFMLSLLKS